MGNYQLSSISKIKHKGDQRAYRTARIRKMQLLKFVQERKHRTHGIFLKLGIAVSK
jgi:hypothetical protein